MPCRTHDVRNDKNESDKTRGFPGVSRGWADYPSANLSSGFMQISRRHLDVAKTSHPESHVNWMSRTSFRVRCFRMVHDSLGLTEGLSLRIKLDSQFNNNNNYYYHYYSPSILRQVKPIGWNISQDFDMHLPWCIIWSNKGYHSRLC